MPTYPRNNASPKEPLPDSERIRKHFKSLVAQIDGGHLKNAIKTCNKSTFRNHNATRLLTSPVLHLKPNDPDALQTKLTLLLHTDQHALALALSEALVDGEQETTFPLMFGRAYALYRLNREPEAHEVVGHIKPMGQYEERGVLHMKAQIVKSHLLSISCKTDSLAFLPQGVSPWQL
jgi:signal recognition particle subunit SRP72